MYKCVPFFHINLFTFMPQSWVLILLIKKKKKKLDIDIDFVASYRY